MTSLATVVVDSGIDVSGACSGASHPELGLSVIAAPGIGELACYEENDSAGVIQLKFERGGKGYVVRFTVAGNVVSQFTKDDLMQAERALALDVLAAL